jgi:predicted secreted acid phosphatase
MRRVGKLIWALLRELADESAYQRHLAAHGRAHTAAEWRRFSEKRQSAAYARPKCC